MCICETLLGSRSRSSGGKWRGVTCLSRGGVKGRLGPGEEVLPDMEGFVFVS